MQTTNQRDDDDDSRDEADYLPECWKCHDTGRVVAMDGFHEYLGYEYVACKCKAGLSFVPMPPNRPWDT